MSTPKQTGAQIAPALLEDGVLEQVFSGAQAAWCTPKDPPVAACAGTTRNDNGETITPDTLFDIASLTKIFSASSALVLADRGKLDLNAPLESHFKGLAHRPAGRATVTQLLAHEAGFEAWLPLFENVAPADRGQHTGAGEITRLALAAPHAHQPGTAACYSDLGYIILKSLLEQVTDDPFPKIITDCLITPLGLSRTRFTPLNHGGPTQIAATERCPWRGRTLVGEVHDDNAWAMGGVSGHAGLFSTAEEVALLGSAWLDSLVGRGWLSQPMAREAVRRRTLGRGLGWDLKSGATSAAGGLLGPLTFGHLGFTGCSLWVDPERKLSIALLTNRVHLGRENITIRQFRPRFHDTLVAAMD